MSRMIACLVLGFGLALFAGVATADGPRDAPDILVVVGAPGTEAYGEQFDESAERWGQLAKEVDATLQFIGRDSDNEVSDHQRIRLQIDRLAKQPPSPLWIVMIGHGTFTRGVAKFNLRGPDLSATELAQWLQPVERPLVVVNSTSSSGPFINRLSGPNRVIITATKSGTEQNFSRFGTHFIAAIATPDSDLDHDDEVSVLEAFLSASARVRDYYDAEARILTEHALIDDNGDGKGTPATMFRAARAIATASDGSELDGVTAARMTLTPPGAQMAFTKEELIERDGIEDELRSIRSQQDSLGELEYDQRIEPLMLRLAELYRAVESRADDAKP